MICPSVSCCFSHTFHLCCCYSSCVFCFNGPIPYRITELEKLAYWIILLSFSLKFSVVYARYFQIVIQFVINVHLFFIRFQNPLIVEEIFLLYNFVICYNFTSNWTSSFKCQKIFFCADILNPGYVIIWFNLYQLKTAKFVLSKKGKSIIISESNHHILMSRWKWV
jgi:hypothetical protein